MTRERDYATVRTAALRCGECGATRVGLTHGSPDCDGAVVADIDGWRCGDCGAAVRRADTCPDCGATGAADGVTAAVDPRPETPVPVVESAVRERLTRVLPRPVTADDQLRAVARAHCHGAVERRHYGDSDPQSLGDRLDLRVPSLWAYAAREIALVPDGRTVVRVAEEVVGSLSDLPPEGGDWTHLGVGAAFGPDGRVRVAVVFAVRPARPDPAALERAVHGAVNDRRRSEGLDALSYAPHLAAVARGHSRDMALRDFFAHESPDGDEPSDRYRRGGHDPRPAGENIARRSPVAGRDETAIAEAVVDGWMDSPGHRENVLRPGWEAEGVGVYRADDGAVFVTENFR